MLINNKTGWLNSESAGHLHCNHPMNSDASEDQFPTLPLISTMLVFLIAAILNNSLVMLVSALLPTPLLLWRLFVTLDEWEARRAAMKTAAASTTNSAASTAATNTQTLST